MFSLSFAPCSIQARYPAMFCSAVLSRCRGHSAAMSRTSNRCSPPHLRQGRIVLPARVMHRLLGRQRRRQLPSMRGVFVANQRASVVPRCGFKRRSFHDECVRKESSTARSRGPGDAGARSMDRRRHGRRSMRSTIFRARPGSSARISSRLHPHRKPRSFIHVDVQVLIIMLGPSKSSRSPSASDPAQMGCRLQAQALRTLLAHSASLRATSTLSRFWIAIDRILGAHVSVDVFVA